MDIKYLFRDLLRTKNIQEWINNRFQDPNKFVIDTIFFDMFPILTMPEGIRYYNSRDLTSICEAFKDYHFSDIKKDDVVIDVGANVGGFAIRAAQFSENVFAVEPLMNEELKRNIDLNQFKITIIVGALGNGKKYDISWGPYKKTLLTYSLSELKRLCGGCDFLKCDCEGFEWFIKPNELDGIRRIEIELHNINPSHNDPYLLMDYIEKNFDTVLVSKDGKIVEKFSMHFKKEFTDYLILHAAKK